MELTGPWRAAAADEGLRRAYPDPGFEDGAWQPVEVPGHWRSTAAFAAHDGPLLYRTRFDAPAPGEGRRSWLVLDGVFYQSDVWLDGAYVGDTEGYFFAHTCEVTAALRDRTEHVLALEVACARPGDLTAKRNITGVFQHWGQSDPSWNPGGIWRPVRIEETGPVRIARIRALCLEATEENAVVSLQATLDSVDAREVRVRTAIDTTETVEEHALATGENVLRWTVSVERPSLWWPHALGDQPLVDVVVDVVLDDGESSDRRSFRTGLRQVRMERWAFVVNGERLFVKGTNLGPTRLALAEATADEIERDIVLAKAAGLDLVRVHGHIGRDELYDAADRHGVLVWQDLPLQWSYARGIRKQATRQAREAVDRLGAHPSIALWCAHNEPLGVVDDDEPPAGLRRVVQQQLPTWNKTVLDASVTRALERADPSRPVVPHSGVPPHAGSGGTDSHLYLGWRRGEAGDLADLAASFPRLVRFVSELGAPAVPSAADFAEPHRWPHLDWDRLEGRHAFDRDGFAARVDPAQFETFEAWRAASQRYQADLIRRQIEALRLLKYRPTGGFCQFMLADAQPAISYSVLDHERQPKLAYAALAEACAPVIVVATWPDDRYRPGSSIALDVHVVSDLRVALEGAEVTATLHHPGGERVWRWHGDVPVDACVLVGRIHEVLPDAPGPITIDLELASPAAKASSRYVSVVGREISAR